MIVQYLSQSGRLTSRKNDNEFYIVHSIREATDRDRVTGSHVCNQMFVSPSEIGLFDKCISGHFYDLVYEFDGRFATLKEVNEVEK